MAEPAEQLYVFSKDAVLRSIATLEQQPIHEHFSGYLAILRALKIGRGLEPVKVTDIKEFHERYLHVLGAPERSPYVRPFKSRGKGSLSLFNSNVSGSYSPSSIRADSPLAGVVEVHGTNRESSYSLKEGHAEAAFESLLKSRKIPAGALVAFLYRDYGFRLAESSIQNVIYVFRDEFGLSGEAGSETYGLLFEDDSGNFSSSDFENRTGGDHDA